MISARKTGRWFSLAASLGVLLTPTAASASPPDLFGFGGRTTGLAMTGVSYADDYEAVFANPAGLTRAERQGITIGLHGAAFELELDGQPFHLDGSNASTIGFQLPLPFGGPLEDVLTMGAGFFTPANVVLRNDIIFPEREQFPVLARSQAITVQFGLGIDLTRWVPGLRLGFGISALADTRGRLLVELDSGNRFVSQTETQLLAGFNPIAGVMLDVGDFGFGFVFRREVKAEIGLDIVIENLPIELPRITIDAIAQYDPHTLALEGNWMATEHIMLVAHLTYRMWSNWPGVVGKSSEFSNLPPDPEFRDTVSPRVAIEWSTWNERTRASVRGGYAYEMTPAPPARTAPKRDNDGEPLLERGVLIEQPLRYLDSDRHILTVGAGFEYDVSDVAVLTFDIYGQLQVVTERTHDIAATGNDGGADIVTSGFIPAFGWTAGVEW